MYLFKLLCFSINQANSLGKIFEAQILLYHTLKLHKTNKLSVEYYVFYRKYSIRIRRKMLCKIRYIQFRRCSNITINVTFENTLLKQ